MFFFLKKTVQQVLDWYKIMSIINEGGSMAGGSVAQWSELGI